VRRVGEVAALFADAGLVTIVALVSPSAADRAIARAASPEDTFFEIYAKADAATCAARDPKAHYAAATAGEIANFTGVDGGYEPPEHPDLALDTSSRTIDDCASELTAFVFERIRWTSGAEGWSL
jgi:adenylylsulfate kinase-like enzyme